MVKIEDMFLSPRFLLFILSIITCSLDYGQETDTADTTRSSENVKAFMNEHIQFERYVFQPGEFPEFEWENKERVNNEVGEFQLKVSYYDKNFRKVKKAETKGRYGAVVEGVTPGGIPVRRYITLFCTSAEFDDYSMNVPITMNRLDEYGIPDKNWEMYSENEERFSFGTLKMFPYQNADAAVFLAGLNEIEKYASYETPRIMDRQWWITLKQKLEKIPSWKNPLRRIETALEAPEILEYADTTAGYDPERIHELRKVCEEWARKGEVPNVTLIVHAGKIIFHEAFGTDAKGNPIDKESKIWMASITKLLSGVLMMQFVDQNIISLDSAASNYLPEFKGSKAILVRDLFTHTTGLDFAGEWASDWNYSLENQVAHLLSSIELTKSFSYNRVGYAIAGKIMERISGYSVPFLFQKYIFQPLDMYSAYSDNTYGGLYCTAYDLAKLGQILISKGSYRGRTLFSEESFEKMLPSDIPNSNRKWGIGTSPMNICGLSDSAFGHSAASGSVFKIDPENELIIISARNAQSKFQKEFECSLIEKSLSLIKNQQTSLEIKTE